MQPGILAGMFYGHAHEISLIVEICIAVHADFLCFSNFLAGELDECRVGIWKIFDLHPFTFIALLSLWPNETVEKLSKINDVDFWGSFHPSLHGDR